MLQKYKNIWTKIEDLKNIKLNALPVYDKRYIKTKIRIYSDKVFTSFRGLNEAKGCVERESFTNISVDSLLLFENKYYLQVSLDNCAYNIVDKQMIDYLDYYIFDSDEN